MIRKQARFLLEEHGGQGWSDALLLVDLALSRYGPLDSYLVPKEAKYHWRSFLDSNQHGRIRLLVHRNVRLTQLKIKWDAVYTLKWQIDIIGTS